MDYQDITYGTYRIKEELRYSLIDALDAGFRGIDTANLYNNEHIIGNCLVSNHINRNEIWITSKLSPKIIPKTEAEIIQSITKTFNDLNTNYLDLYLLHSPVKDHNTKAWSIIEEFYKKGYFRNIGVSNFDIDHINEITNFSTTPIFTNQIELSPFLTRPKIVNFMKNNNLKITAHSSLAKGEKFDNPVLQSIAKKYSKSEAQIMLKWGQQNGYYIIPRSSNKLHIVEDINLDFKLSCDDIEILNGLNINYTTHPQYKLS